MVLHCGEIEEEKRKLMSFIISSSMNSLFLLSENYSSTCLTVNHNLNYNSYDNTCEFRKNFINFNRATNLG